MTTIRRRRALGLVLAGLVVMGAAAAGNRRAEAPRAVEYRVQSGDTLWRLAAQVPLPGADRRELVWMLKQINGLSQASLSVGQTLVLPADAASVRAALAHPRVFREQLTLAEAAEPATSRQL